MGTIRDLLAAQGLTGAQSLADPPPNYPGTTPVGGWLRNLALGPPPQIPPPLGAATLSPTGLPPPTPASLHDYPSMAARPLSQNIEDRRFDQPRYTPSSLATLLGPWGSTVRTLAALPPGPGPAPTGSPYPTAPQATPGGSILWQHLDPTTTMLSNIPTQIPTQAPGAPPPAPGAPPSGPLGGLDLSRILAGEMPRLWTTEHAGSQATGDPKQAFHSLSKLLQDERHSANPDLHSPDSVSLLQSLIDNGHITVSADDYDNTTGLPFPGGKRTQEQLTRLVDFWRDM